MRHICSDIDWIIIFFFFLNHQLLWNPISSHSIWNYSRNYFFAKCYILFHRCFDILNDTVFKKIWYMRLIILAFTLKLIHCLICMTLLLDASGCYRFLISSWGWNILSGWGWTTIDHNGLAYILLVGTIISTYFSLYKTIQELDIGFLF